MKRKLEKSMEKMYTASIIILSILFVLACVSSLTYIGENRSLKANNEFLKERNEELTSKVTMFDTLYGPLISKNNDDLVNLSRQLSSTGYTLIDYIAGLQDQITELSIVCDDKDKSTKNLKNKLKKVRKKYKKVVSKGTKKYSLTNNQLSTEKQKRADDIAYIAYQNYDKYGILPSVAVGQACEETGLGTDDTSATPYYGWWGVTSTIPGKTYATYTSLESGCLAYLKTLNNGMYDGAVFNKDYQSATMAIQNGGYCEPREGYSDRVNDSIESHNFTEYDRYYLGL